MTMEWKGAFIDAPLMPIHAACSAATRSGLALTSGRDRFRDVADALRTFGAAAGGAEHAACAAGAIAGSLLDVFFADHVTNANNHGGTRLV
jgi:hypothetical protein